MFAETGVRGEVVLLAVLEDEDAAGCKDARLQHEIGNVGKVGQGIGRVGEDEGESPTPVGVFNCGFAAVQVLLRSVQSGRAAFNCDFVAVQRPTAVQGGFAAMFKGSGGRAAFNGDCVAVQFRLHRVQGGFAAVFKVQRLLRSG